MRGAAIIIVVAFSVALGHLSWRTWGPPVSPEYALASDVALVGRNGASRHLYLRLDVRLTERPQQAWIEALSPDVMTLYVNGTSLPVEGIEGTAIAAVVDVAPHMKAGHNVIAVAVEQLRLGEPPRVAIRGGYVVSGQTQRFDEASPWRASDRFERAATWWFAPGFDASAWPEAERAESRLRAAVQSPPGAVTTPGRGRWISAPRLGSGGAVLSRTIHLAAAPRAAWLRVTSTSAHRLAVNGTSLAREDAQLGCDEPADPVRRVYDITPFLRRGMNEIAFAVIDPGAAPPLLVDGHVVDRTGRAYAIASDEEWTSRMGPRGDGPVEPCHVDAGDQSVPLWKLRQTVVDVALPGPVLLTRAAGWGAVVVGIAGVTLLLCAVAGRVIARPGAGRAGGMGIACVALLPATVAIAAAILATYDPRVSAESVYRARWVVLAAASVPVQWALLALGGLIPRPGRPIAPAAWRLGLRSAPAVCMLGLLVLGFWLRARGIAVEPMHHDEVRAYKQTMGVLERGFPSIQVGADVPVQYISTSEIFYYPAALAALVFDDARAVVRFPAVVWGTLTILLVYAAGRSFFGRATGLIAAAVYTVAPACIGMSTFGRYPSQLQFFALLTVCLLWRAVQGSGPLRRGAVWMTALSFIAMYLTWEGSGVLAAGLAAAALVQRRGRLHTIFGSTSVWGAGLLVAIAISLQWAHRSYQRSQRLVYGMGLSELSMKPMWKYPDFDPGYFVLQSSWSEDALLPMLGLAAALLLAVRHGYARPARFLGIVLLATAGAMALLLPIAAWRYSYHFVPLVMLLGSAAVAAGARAVGRLAGDALGAPLAWRVYARAVCVVLVLAAAAAGSGAVLRLDQMRAWRVGAFGEDDLRFPDVQGPVEFVLEHFEAGDVILASRPHVVDHYLAERDSDFWLQSRLHTQAVLGDDSPLPRDRRSGTVMLGEVRSLEDLFARHRRIWYIATPSAHEQINLDAVSSFMLQNMDVVYEDFKTMVLLHGDLHRTARARLRSEETLDAAQSRILK